MTMVACSNVMDEYCRRPCYVVIDNSLHLDPSLAAAMNPISPGVFCTIKETLQGGAYYYAFATNTGLSSSVIMNAIELKVTRIVGMNNGVIVGYGNLDNPAIFYAYDLECPNCFDPDAVPVKSKALTIDDKGHASCKVCSRIYDLNNRGYIIQGESGNPLNRYPASTTGPFGNLVIQ